MSQSFTKPAHSSVLLFISCFLTTFISPSETIMPLVDALYHRLFTSVPTRPVEFRTYGRSLEDFEADEEKALLSLSHHPVRRAYATKTIEWYRDKTASTRKFPDDIVIQIFEHCLLHSSAQNSIMSPTSAPLILTRVCRRWRHLALNTSSLWTSIHVVVPHILTPRDARRFDKKLEAMREWLDRSLERTLSISVALDDEIRWCDVPHAECPSFTGIPEGYNLALEGPRHGHAPKPEHFPPYFRKLWNALKPYASRTGDFRLPACIDGGVLLPGEEKPNLFTLQLSRLKRLSYPRSLFKDDAIALLDAPKLEEILLAYIPRNVTMRQNFWTQLRVVEIEFIHAPEAILEFLGRCANAERCTISCSNETHLSGKLQEIRLPRLKMMGITGSRVVVEELLKHIDMPNLETMYIQEPDYTSRRQSESIFRSPLQFNAKLKSLTLQLDPTTAPCTSSGYHLVAFLKNQVGLENLEFHEPANKKKSGKREFSGREVKELDAVMISVYHALADCRCLPALKTFVLNSTLQLRPAVLDAFRAFVQSRSETLQVKIQIPRNELLEDDDWERLLGVGVQLVVVDYVKMSDVVAWVGANVVDEWHRGKRRSGERREVGFGQFLEERERERRTNA